MKHIVLSFALALTATAAGQSTVRLESQEIRVDEAPRAVTLYAGRAAVTRSARRLLGPGTYGFVFPGLPESVQPESLQAHVSGPGRVVGVEYRERAVRASANPRLEELDTLLAQNADAIRRRTEDRGLIESRGADLDAMSAHVAQSAAVERGTGAVDLDAVGDQLAFFAVERRKLLDERRTIDDAVRELEEVHRLLESERESLAGTSGTAREATVTVAAEGGTEIGVDLVYLVTNATWAPAYNVRAAGDGSRVDIEYDALIEQRSGEDWSDVRLVLSTAEPTRATDPPPLEPWVVDVREERPARAAAKAIMGTELRPPGPPPAADSIVHGSGPAVTYAIARPVSIPTDARRQQRVRITGLTCRPVYTHVAIPLLTDAVYVRSDLRNPSEYLLLPGPAGIFAGADYVGPTRLGPIAPGEAFEVYFGVDRSVRATRKLLAEEVAKTGLLGGGRKTSYDYRIEIENGAGKEIRLELWDRMPVSRSDRIQVQLVGLTHDLSADPKYFEEDFSRGLLEWELTVPAGAQNENAMTVEFGVRVVHAKEVEVSGLP